MRSKVASQKEFIEWDFRNINNLPTLFQERIKGKDLRVHVCQNNYWSLLVDSKDFIDYRYASKESIVYKHITLPNSIKYFCKTLAEIERNNLIGIDLIKKKNDYFCLESNPGPGWSTFNHSGKKQFAKKILKAF